MWSLTSNQRNFNHFVNLVFWEHLRENRKNWKTEFFPFKNSPWRTVEYQSLEWVVESNSTPFLECNLQHSRVLFLTFHHLLGLFSEDRTFHKSCEVNNDCKGRKQYCNTAIRLCECQPFFEYRIDTSNCSPCPLEGEECMGCCSNSNLRCYNNVCSRCDDNYYECE